MADTDRLRGIRRGLNPRAVADLLGVSISFVYDEIKAGRMPHVRLGLRRIVVEADQLEEYLDLRRHSAEEAAAKWTKDRLRVSSKDHSREARA
jgi:excisionase family DNA binding protein